MPVLDISDPNAWEWKIGHDGKRVKVLADNVRGVRVRTMLRDSSTVAGQIAAERQSVVDAGGGSGFGLRRPGNRFASDASARDAAEQAYAQMVADSSDAWRRGPGGHQDASALGTEYVGGQPGSPCTVRTGGAEGYLEGSPGHLARVDGKLVCVPDKPALRRADSMSVADAHAIKDRAYDEMCRRSEDAWRHLGESS